MNKNTLVSTLKADEIAVRDMMGRDLSQVLFIERNAQVSPWSRLSFEESLTKQYICRVLETEQEIVAYHIVCPVADELHILNVVVAPPLQRAGLGHSLMNDIVDIAQSKALKRIFLEVRASNHTAQNLYLKWQFEQISVRKNYYRACQEQKTPLDMQEQSSSSIREDALVFMRQLSV